MAEDYYALLGVPKTASQEEIKKAYRKLSKQFHPDVNPNNREAEEKFKKINEAYSIVGDENKRKEYDNPLKRGFGPNGFPEGFDFFNDFFSGNFGFNRQRNQQSQQAPRKGQDLRVNLMFSIEEVIKGTTKTLRYNRNVNCNSCGGNGSRNGNSFRNCDNCAGVGHITQIITTPFGRIQNTAPCNVCGGKGKIVSEKCSGCGGQGLNGIQEQITLNVPSGISDGFTYKIESAGSSIAGVDRPGDLVVVCMIQDDLIYKRINGIDLHRDIFISIVDAMIGRDDYKLDVFGDEIKIKLEPNSENGKMLRLKGKGLPGQNGQRGDLFLHVNVFIPKNINTEAMSLLKSIESELSPAANTINYDAGVLNRAMKFNTMYSG